MAQLVPARRLRLGQPDPQHCPAKGMSLLWEAPSYGLEKKSLISRVCSQRGADATLSLSLSRRRWEQLPDRWLFLVQETSKTSRKGD